MEEAGTAENSNAADFKLKGGETIPVLGWGRAEVDEFQRIWSSMIGNSSEELKVLGINLLIWMFEHVPNMKVLFSNFDASQSKDLLVSDEKFLRHTQRVVVNLNKLIKRLDTPEKFMDDVIGLARSHMALQPRVNGQYFEDFRDNFHLLVKDLTGTSKTDRPATLWFQFLDALCTVIKQYEKGSHDPVAAAGATNKKGGSTSLTKACCAII